MESFVFSMNAVLPLVCLAGIGYLLRQTNFITEDFIKTGNKFVFKFCLSALMFVNVYSIDKMNTTYYKIMIFSASAILSLIGIGFLYCALFIHDNKQKGVVAQAFFRSNFAIIGIPLAQSLYGDAGGAVGAVILTCTIPLFNIFSVIALTIFVNDGTQKISIKNMLYKIITNPLIDGIILAAICLVLRPHLNGWTLKNGEIRFVYKIIENMSRIASPLSLVILGGQFHFSAVRKLLSKIILSVSVRLVIVPLIGLIVVHFIFPEFGGPEYAGLLALFGSPIAVSSAIMANQMNNDGELAGQILVWSTLFSGFTLFCFITFFRATGIF